MVSFPDPRASHPYHMHDMIRSQPGFAAETLRRVAEVAAESFLGSARRLVITGCGTSFHAACYGARVLGAAMGPRVLAEPIQAYDLLHGPPIDADVSVVGVSHSGNTATTNRALSRARRSGGAVLGMSGLPDTPMQGIADRTLVIGSTHDRSWANTMSYTTQLTAFAALAARLGGPTWRPVARGLRELPSALESALDCESAVRRLARSVARRERVTFVGSGLDEITALEAALKIRETCSLPASGYHIEQLLHGPFLSLSRDDSIVALLSREDRGRTDKILEGLAGTGARVTRVGGGPGVQIPLPSIHHVLRPIVSVVPLQFLAYYAALERKADPDIMRSDVARYQKGLALLFT